MTIWILALGLLLSLAALGYRQGAIRVAFSLVGIVISASLAGPLAKHLYPILPRVGLKDPTVIWLVSPVIVFWLLMIPFKSVGFLVHRKVELYFKYKAEGLQALRWTRLNTRLGLCLGPLNALIYLVLISFIIFDLSYWSTQVAISESEPAWIRLLNRLGRDSETTGFAQIALAMDPMPDSYFQYADLAGLLIQNPQLADRLADYPMFISLTERDDFKQLGQNSDFQNAWKQHAPIQQLLDNPQFQSLWQNQETANLVWGIVQDNFDDLVAYLKTGKSQKYGSQAIVGRWDLNIAATTSKLLESRPVISSREMRTLRAWVSQAYTNTAFVAGADRQAFLKNLPHMRVQPVQKGQPPQPPTTEIASWQGRWKADGTDYELALSSGGKKQSLPAQLDGDRLTIQDDKTTLVFERQE
ncbi:MAG TPA: CvpA family protein [Candidatus Acidoferrum sp.]|nr:CvpA family protein [Candidatus Acidoferrum sp.]